MTDDPWRRVVERDLDRLDAAQTKAENDLWAEIKVLRGLIDNLRLWRSWVLGATFVVVFLAGVFSKQFIAILGKLFEGKP